jgi:hypothetical protein
VDPKSQSLDEIHKTIADELKNVYPPIPYMAKGLWEGSLAYLVVIVQGSEHRPHFAGQSFIRQGSQTIAASEEQYATLIAERQSKVRELLKFKGQAIVVVTVGHAGRSAPRGAVLEDFNQFYATLLESGARKAISLGRIEILHDYKKGCLKIEIPE